MALNNVRLDPFGIRAYAAPLRLCRRIRWRDKAVVLREPDAYWSEVAAALNRAREALYRRFTDARDTSGRDDAPSSPAEFGCAPWSEAEVAVVCHQDGAPADKLTRCETCGDHFVSFSAWQGTVGSDKCKPKRPSQAKPKQERVCAACGTTYAPTRSATRACST